MDAIYPKIPLVNREQKRQFEREAKKAFDLLSEVNVSFIEYVFTQIENEGQYEYVYSKHLEMWLLRCQYIVDIYKPKILLINSHWFEKNYKNEIK